MNRKSSVFNLFYPEQEVFPYIVADTSNMKPRRAFSASLKARFPLAMFASQTAIHLYLPWPPWVMRNR